MENSMDAEVKEEPKAAPKSKRVKKETAKSIEGKKTDAAAKKAATAKKTPAKKETKEYTKMAKLEEARNSYKWWEAAELPAGQNWIQLEQPGILFPEPYVPHGKPLIYDGKAMIKEFDKCKFDEIRNHLELQKSLRKAATTEEKEKIKAIKEKNSVAKGFCIIDAHLERMGNFNMEPPSLFRGRGDHPLTGTLKRRTFSDQVMLNMSVDAAVPKCDLPGRHWQAVQHNPEVTWLCGWKENVNDSNKYVMLSAASSFKGKSDRDKYGKAINLLHCIDKVRKDYKTKIASSDKADHTVGCCSLRLEHFRFNEDPDSYELELEFLGKDSMLFKQTINFATIEHPSGDIGKDVFKSTDEVLDTLNPSILNKHLSSLMPGLSAKVFRTFNASITLEKELPGDTELAGKTVPEKVTLYNDANRLVAILCNHQKTVSKAQETQLEKLDTNLENLKNQLGEIKKWLALVKKGDGAKIPLKADDSAITDEEKVASVKALEEAKTAQRADALRKQKDKITAAELKMKAADDNKEVALGTSKINYMDPRISVAWCKRHEVPIDKVFARALRDKFNWAMAVPPDWKFI
eukprot:GSChrysophyteH1.ASY1.ANO1.1537.1 assembled CDS